MNAAALISDPKIIDKLIKAGADIEARNENGKTPLMYAAQSNSNPKVIEELLNSGADIEARDEEGLTPLMRAAASQANSEVIEARKRLAQMLRPGIIDEHRNRPLSPNPSPPGHPRAPREIKFPIS